jgi:ectoine hydroxylase-related dioxygenase (phytanoyl-CoA dioxygenase family)
MAGYGIPSQVKKGGSYVASYEAPENELPNNPQTRSDIQQVLERGFVILRDVFTLEEAEEAKQEIDRLSRKDGRAETGRNPFEGLNTNRIYALLNKSRVFDKFAMLPRVLALNDYFLDPNYQLSAMHTIQINPGEVAQQLHHDDGYCRMPRPRPPLGSAIMVALDDFTEENGATRLVPGSHKWEHGRPARQEETIPAVMSVGSVVYFIGTVWHGGGNNRTAQPRQSLTVQYCQRESLLIVPSPSLRREAWLALEDTGLVDARAYTTSPIA